MGKVESAVKRLIDSISVPTEAEEALGELALKVAKALDEETDARQLPNLSKELRLALKQLQDGSPGGSDDGWGDLSTPE